MLWEAIKIQKWYLAVVLLLLSLFVYQFVRTFGDLDYWTVAGAFMAGGLVVSMWWSVSNTRDWLLHAKVVTAMEESWRRQIKQQDELLDLVEERK